MNLLVSQMPYFGWSVENIFSLPRNLGIEFFIEFGNQYYYDKVIEKAMKERKGPLSIHGPFTMMNLASKACDFEAVMETYRIAFDYCARYHALHCVCHPHAEWPEYEDFSLEDGQKLVVERVLKLNEEAKRMGVQMLVENMPYRKLIFDQKDFTEILGAQKELSFLIDTGHAILNGWRIDEVQKALQGRIHGYHIHENKGDFDAHLQIVTGLYDWKKFFANYKKYTPDAAIVMEYSKWNVAEVSRNVERIEELMR